MFTPKITSNKSLFFFLFFFNVDAYIYIILIIELTLLYSQTVKSACKYKINIYKNVHYLNVFSTAFRCLRRDVE